MRDPDGKIRFEGSLVIRECFREISKDHFLHSDVAIELVKQNRIVPYYFKENSEIISERLPFITYPTEWCPSQLFDAAKFMLSLQEDLNAAGFDLKDASAWNVAFDGMRPVFVDLLSFDVLRDRSWHAFGQFFRHFIFPLLLYKHRSMLPNECFQTWRDGVPSKRVAELLGLRRFATRYWPLMLEARESVFDTVGAKQVFESEDLKRFRKKLLATLSFFLDGVKPTQGGTPTYWQNYKQDRPHYSQSAIDFKLVTVNAWLERLKPTSVLDVGGNSGEFSLIAASHGSTALCWDSDVGAIEKFYLSNADRLDLHSILAPIDNLHGGFGWSGSEFNGLIHRLEGQVDTVLLLAVIHHLGVACAVRLEDIFGLMRTISAKNIICEFLGVNDQRLISLCQQYRREISDFTIDKQKEAAIRAGYKIVETAREGRNSSRELALLSSS